ncbi:MAG: helix-turn-helix domain-containing protein [Niabella sp.]
MGEVDLIILTKEHLEEFRSRLLEDIKELIKPLFDEKPENEKPEPKKWLRSNEVLEMLGISMGTLQKHSHGGKLTPTKIGGLNFYSREEIIKILNRED